MTVGNSVFVGFDLKRKLKNVAQTPRIRGVYATPPAQERRKEEAARMALLELRNALVGAEGLLGEQ